MASVKWNSDRSSTYAYQRLRCCSDLSLVQKMEQEVRGRSRCIIFCRCPPCIEWGEFKAGFWCGRSRKKFQCACQGPVSLEVFQCLQRGKMERARSKRQGLDAGRSRLAPQSPSNISTLPFLSFWTQPSSNLVQYSIQKHGCLPTPLNHLFHKIHDILPLDNTVGKA